MHWYLYFIGVILGGYRRGEMTALEWPFVDFVAGGFWIDKQITFDEFGKPTEAPVKTEESEAFVPMPRWYMGGLEFYSREWEAERDRLLEAGLWQGGEKGQVGEKQYLFHNGYGHRLYPDAPTLKWARIRKAKNIPSIRLHDLRHTTAKLLQEEFVDLKAIQNHLRHARFETTTNIYMDKSALVSRAAADKLEKLNPFNSGTNWGQNAEND